MPRAADQTTVEMTVSNLPIRRLVLASQSPRRIELLRLAGYEPDIQPANVDEENFPPSTMPIDLALQLAKLKADAIAPSFPDHVILAADTVVAFGDWVIGKPRDLAHARKILELLSGTTHVVITGVSVVCRAADFVRHARVMCSVQMKTLSPSELDRYLGTGLWHGKAGAYGIQDPNPIVRCLHGDITNVIGLPMIKTKKLLKEAGILPTEK